MDARRYNFPQDWTLIPVGLEQECRAALNAVAMSKRVTVSGANDILVGGKQSKSLSTLSLYVGIDGVLDLLAGFGLAVTTYRERNNPF